jgi:hypothetical protein
MARYYFHVQGQAVDDEGSELADMARVRRVALISFCETLRDAAREDDPRELSMQVTDQAGQVQLRLRFDLSAVIEAS